MEPIKLNAVHSFVHDRAPELPTTLIASRLHPLLCPVKRWDLDFRTCNMLSVYHAFYTGRHSLSATEYFPARALQRTVDKGPMNPGPRYYILEYCCY